MSEQLTWAERLVAEYGAEPTFEVTLRKHVFTLLNPRDPSAIRQIEAKAKIQARASLLPEYADLHPIDSEIAACAFMVAEHVIDIRDIDAPPPPDTDARARPLSFRNALELSKKAPAVLTRLMDELGKRAQANLVAGEIIKIEETKADLQNDPIKRAYLRVAHRVGGNPDNWTPEEWDFARQLLVGEMIDSEERQKAIEEAKSKGGGMAYDATASAVAD